MLSAGMVAGAAFITGAALIVAGVDLLVGHGWALVAAGVPLLAFGSIVTRGLFSGRQVADRGDR